MGNIKREDIQDEILVKNYRQYYLHNEYIRIINLMENSGQYKPSEVSVVDSLDGLPFLKIDNELLLEDGTELIEQSEDDCWLVGSNLFFTYYKDESDRVYHEVYLVEGEFCDWELPVDDYKDFELIGFIRTDIIDDYAYVD